MAAELSGAWTHRLAHPSHLVWPILSDTNRFNEMSGLPRYELLETAEADGTVQRIANGRIGRFVLQWEELPVEWVAEQYYSQTRLFLNGPLRRMTASMRLTPVDDGAEVIFRVAITSRYPVLGPYIAGRMIRGGGRTFALAVQGANEVLLGARASAFDLSEPVILPGGVARAKEIAAYIQSGPYDHGLSRRLMDLVLGAPDTDACRLRPLELARKWDVAPRHAIELCLAAVRSGLLRLTWDILCPRCRGAKASTPRLDKLEENVHCPSCNVDFDAQFGRNVELVFHPAASVRECSAGEYCLSGPQSTPHVLIQQTVAPGETRHVKTALAPGEYRLRTLSGGGECDISYAGGAFPAMAVTGGGIVAYPTVDAGTLTFVNATGKPLCLLIESREWVRDALTAHHVTTLQTFRHLFPDQVLRPGEEMSIDSVTLMFTDLQGSTALYREIGDGPAYDRVREHFEFLAEIVRAHSGAMVKTIGDAVMAAFIDPALAVRAALAVQKKTTEFNQGHAATAVKIKIGLHSGRCLVVNLNDRLDYFGSTVNLAARLQGQSRGGDIVISQLLAGDAQVAAVLESIHVSREEATLKGFDRAVPFVRVAAASP